MAWEAFIRAEDFSRNLGVYVRDENFRDGTVRILGQANFLTRDKDRLSMRPIEREEVFLDGRENEVRAILQAIVDACWEHGIRPTGHDDFRRDNDARGAHLADMRHLVAALTGAPLPGTDAGKIPTVHSDSRVAEAMATLETARRSPSGNAREPSQCD